MRLKFSTRLTALDGKRSVIVIDYGTNLGHRPSADWRDIMWQTSHAEDRDSYNSLAKGFVVQGTITLKRLSCGNYQL